MKLCRICGLTKPLDLFNKNKSKSDGLQSNCKECHRDQTKSWDQENADRRRDSSASWWRNNPEKNRQKFKRWYENNKGKHQALCAMRRAWLKRCGVDWKEDRLITAIYKFGSMLRSQGFPAEVDHVIAIKHKDVCGLHVAANLQILKKVHNGKRGNRHLDDYYEPVVLDPLFWRYVDIEGLDTGGLTIKDYQSIKET